ncbi:MAG: zinc ribbon domain-containing protein [Christensenellaceae bacterium]
MTEFETLLHYQDVDGKLRVFEQEIASSEERKKYFSAKKFLEKASEKLEILDNKAASLERSATLLTRRYVELAASLKEFDDVDALLAGGTDAGYLRKKVSAISDQLKAIKAELAQLTAQITSIQRDYASLKQQTLTAQKQFKEYRQRYGEIKEAHAPEMAALEKQLAALEHGINPAAMTKYKAKRKEHIFPIVVPLKENRCSFCGMDLPIALQSKLSDGKVIECENCHRIIYKP